MLPKQDSITIVVVVASYLGGCSLLYKIYPALCVFCQPVRLLMLLFLKFICIYDNVSIAILDRMQRGINNYIICSVLSCIYSVCVYLSLLAL